ncbi:3-phosphoinositide dependent protein kinase-1 [Coemansia interrupta]|uniref:non-specific serine/threonine protein kinase n=1 Tax=Coemansia interrupta TaxID=1126814 RepID=A0A9W8LEM4_9FUNG|nr:3-phosphoinositide dependent protein kinase-1 [Coemansia interrupta]
MLSQRNVAVDLEGLVVVAGPGASLPPGRAPRQTTLVVPRPVVETHDLAERLYAKNGLPLFEVLKDASSQDVSDTEQTGKEGPVAAVLRRRQRRRQSSRSSLDVGQQTMGEDLSDEYYRRLHRRPEYLEKRIRNRELELYQYARWRETQRRGQRNGGGSEPAAAAAAVLETKPDALQAPEKKDTAVAEDKRKRGVRSNELRGLADSPGFARAQDRASSSAAGGGSLSPVAEAVDGPRVPELSPAERRAARLGGCVLEQLLIQAARLPATDGSDYPEARGAGGPNNGSDSSIYMQQQPISTTDSVEMRERPRIPPKPANLRSPNTTATVSHTNSLAAEAVRALNASDSPLPSMHTAASALNAAALTPNPPQTQQQHQQQQQSSASAGQKPSEAAAAAPSIKGGVNARKRTVGDFAFGRTLGEGSYSTVVEATEKATGRVFAAKILDKRHIIKEKKIKYVNIERDILQALQHPFVVRLHYAFQDSQSLYFVIDLAANGELLSWIRKLGGLAEESARFYLAEIIVAVEYMHMERTLHRDLKPENILLGSDMHILVTDFGTAKMFAKGDTDQRANSFVGTAEYVSPELLTDKSADRNSDLWAVGCIAYQLLVGRPPFKGLNEYQTFQKILKLDYAFPAGMPPLARDLVERILVLEPERRLGATQRGGFRELKEHAFFDGFDWQGLAQRTPPKMAAGGLLLADQGTGLQRPDGPPAIPPKPPLLRQSNAGADGDDMAGFYDTRQSSSDGFGTEKTSDSYPTSPSASTDPLASAGGGHVMHQLHSYRINPPISPVQTPVHLNYAQPHPPPPPPPPPQQQQQQQQQQGHYGYQHIRQPVPNHPAAYHQLATHSSEADIYNVRLNDHVPPPLKAEEMAAISYMHQPQYGNSNGNGGGPTTSDYYSAASYRPPQMQHHNGAYQQQQQQQQPHVYSNYAAGAGAGGRRQQQQQHSSSSSGSSWTSPFRAVFCCGRGR